MHRILKPTNFNYTKAHPNRFVSQVNEIKITVTLEPDVAKVFKNSEDVNKALRAILSAIPEK
ncbi:MAG: hypothetical protein GPJ15_02585 [Microcystis aeruginosa G11-06]|nr:hypothetical protein [Microcystis aeruginosa G11-06]